MRKHNAENELAKRDYLAFLRNAGGRSETTLDQVAAALDRFETFNGRRSFKAFRREQAISFKKHLAAQINAATGKPLAKATLYSTLKSLRAFFEWLAREPGYRKALVFSDAAYFNVTGNEARIATTSRASARRPRWSRSGALSRPCPPERWWSGGTVRSSRSSC